MKVRQIVRGAVMAALLTAGAIIPSSVASASTPRHFISKLPEACASFEHIGNVKEIPINSGRMCSMIDKTGDTVTGLEYTWIAYKQICDWWVDFDFYNSATGVNYFHHQGGRQMGCANRRHGTGVGNLPTDLYTGQGCATLFTRRVDGVQEVLRTCQNLTLSRDS